MATTTWADNLRRIANLWPRWASEDGNADARDHLTKHCAKLDQEALREAIDDHRAQPDARFEPDLGKILTVYRVKVRDREPSGARRPRTLKPLSEAERAARVDALQLVGIDAREDARRVAWACTPIDTRYDRESDDPSSWPDGMLVVACRHLERQGVIEFKPNKSGLFE